MPASRLRTFLELSIGGAERAASIIRRHSCAWQAVSDSQARSSGSSSRPSGVISRSPRKEKPAQGPVKSIRLCGSNSIMPRSHPWPGTEGAGKSRARGPAIATPRTRTPQPPDKAFRIMYIMFSPLQQECLGTPLTTSRLLHGRLVTPEGRQLLPEDLACVRAGSASATHDSAATRPWRCAAAPSRCSIAALRSRPCRQRPTALPPRCRKPACAQSRSTVLVCLGDAPHLGSTPARCPCSSGARADRCAAGI